ncbi:MAG TPA: acyloxyacyl hydrolase [Gemmatimonadaceae bacterium]|jgi:hypothetical protein
MRVRRLAITLILILGVAAQRGRAQESAIPTYAAWWSAAWHLPVANNSNIEADRTLLVAGFERRFVFTTGRFGIGTYSPALVVSSATHNVQLDSRSCDVGQQPIPNRILVIQDMCFSSHDYSAFGVGIIPLGFRWHILPERRVGFIANLDGGAVWFNHPLPVSSDSRLRGQGFNFLARGGLDAVVRVTGRTWITGGYRHVHLSNGNFGSINPGIDAGLMAFGVAWR